MEIYSLDEQETYEFLQDMAGDDSTEIEQYHAEALRALQLESDTEASLEVSGPNEYQLTVQRSEGEVEIEGELPFDYDLDFDLENVESEVEI